MKATGIVRRIDDLGRIVVPKEIRKVLRIREGDPLEIFTGKEGEIVLKKYSPMADLTAFAQQYVEAISQSLGLPVAITDRDSVIAVAGMPKRELMGKELHSELESVINDRKAIVARKGDAKFIHITTDDLDYDGQVVQTIISEGDAVGSVIVIVRDSGHRIGEIEQKAAVIAAAFFGMMLVIVTTVVFTFNTILNLKTFNYPLTTSNAFDHICRQQTYGFA